MPEDVQGRERARIGSGGSRRHAIVEAELKKRTLTNLYNARLAWLAQAQAALDRPVWAAYGWEEEAEADATPDEMILERLLALNGERAVDSIEGSRGG